ncbi:bacillithiol biosynthesis cysteine-adding enzyme BshC [Pseudalkalibacillus berkeleyi]|uniref:Putative cysteine ligase BshC n=1 Tax=Pseudalkalibacillus berkeleyi TaxID=1069813 RepID=A0ABS9GWC8_9BACL|nr:bacillithiol biosynthesis cysteine-adding enzyme BshC [Pseudalkalibacillus berkeleyi]MCF6137004.1 bacillithiol biosynthesis cysteine-adding enzyme BshC [Pseudalkalibacillus berkeleyi]
MNVHDLPYTKKDDLYTAYLSGDESVRSLFHYDPMDEESYFQRWKALKERKFQREALHNHLKAFHLHLPASEKTFDNIDRLKNPDTTVVVTGQQAGLLTGPLYSIHKCMSAILFAKEKEKQLGAPVVPVFWIAGEDHDFDEVNHINVIQKNDIIKKKILMNEGKRSVSNIRLEKDRLRQWVDEVIRSFGEKKHTQDLKQLMEDAVDHSTSMTDFFAYLMLKLFEDQGLVMMDAHHPEIRKLESATFQAMIANTEEIDGAFQKGSEQLHSLGYPSLIESEENNSHLFIEEQDARVLLIREDGHFRGKNNECLYSKEELLNIAKETPHRLSNNVVTRPLMQELILPTLAFVAGPGEVSYWSMLKSVFEVHNVTMPPIVPRLSLALVDRTTQKMLDETKLDLKSVLKTGTQKEKEKWLSDQVSFDLDAQITKSLQIFKEEHDQLKHSALSLDKGLQQVTEKNWTIIENQINYLKKSMERSIHRQHEVELRKYDYIQAHLLPNGQPQERILNIFYYINEYGMEMIQELIAQRYKWNGNLQIVCI